MNLQVSSSLGSCGFFLEFYDDNFQPVCEKLFLSQSKQNPQHILHLFEMLKIRLLILLERCFSRKYLKMQECVLYLTHSGSCISMSRLHIFF